MPGKAVIAAVSASTGAVLWKEDGLPGSSSVLLSEDGLTVYETGYFLDIVARDSLTGEVLYTELTNLWTFYSTETGSGCTTGYESVGVAATSTLLMGANATNLYVVRGGDCDALPPAASAFNATNGKLVWFWTDDVSGYHDASIDAVLHPSGAHLIMAWADRLVSIDPRFGTDQWTYTHLDAIFWTQDWLGGDLELVNGDQQVLMSRLNSDAWSTIQLELVDALTGVQIHREELPIVNGAYKHLWRVPLAASETGGEVVVGYGTSDGYHVQALLTPYLAPTWRAPLEQSGGQTFEVMDLATLPGSGNVIMAGGDIESNFEEPEATLISIDSGPVGWDQYGELGPLLSTLSEAGASQELRDLLLTPLYGNRLSSAHNMVLMEAGNKTDVQMNLSLPALHSLYVRNLTSTDEYSLYVAPNQGPSAQMCSTRQAAEVVVVLDWLGVPCKTPGPASLSAENLTKLGCFEGWNWGPLHVVFCGAWDAIMPWIETFQSPEPCSAYVKLLLYVSPLQDHCPWIIDQDLGQCPPPTCVVPTPITSINASADDRGNGTSTVAFGPLPLFEGRYYVARTNLSFIVENITREAFGTEYGDETPLPEQVHRACIDKWPGDPPEAYCSKLSEHVTDPCQPGLEFLPACLDVDICLSGAENDFTGGLRICPSSSTEVGTSDSDADSDGGGTGSCGNEGWQGIGLVGVLPSLKRWVPPQLSWEWWWEDNSDNLPPMLWGRVKHGTLIWYQGEADGNDRPVNPNDGCTIYQETTEALLWMVDTEYRVHGASVVEWPIQTSGSPSPWKTEWNAGMASRDGSEFEIDAGHTIPPYTNYPVISEAVHPRLSVPDIFYDGERTIDVREEPDGFYGWWKGICFDTPHGKWILGLLCGGGLLAKLAWRESEYPVRWDERIVAEDSSRVSYKCDGGCWAKRITAGSESGEDGTYAFNRTLWIDPERSIGDTRLEAWSAWGYADGVHLAPPDYSERRPRPYDSWNYPTMSMYPPDRIGTFPVCVEC